MRKIVTQIRSGNIFSYHTIFHFYLYPYFVLTFTAIKPPAFLQFFDNNITFHFQTVRLQFESLSWNISSQFGQPLVRVFTNSLLRYKNIHSLYIVFWSRQNSFFQGKSHEEQPDQAVDEPCNREQVCKAISKFFSDEHLKLMSHPGIQIVNFKIFLNNHLHIK